MITWQAVNLITVLFGIPLRMSPAYFAKPLLQLANFLSATGLILTIILFVKLFVLTDDVKKWVNITFGYYVASNLLAILLLILPLFQATGNTIGGMITRNVSYFVIVFTVLFILIDLIIWWLLHRHVSKMQIGQPSFNNPN